MLKELNPLGSNPASVKLPHSFQKALEKRIVKLLGGAERMPGYSDAAIKRTFAEAYTGFTETNFRRIIEADRKLEPLILKFFTAATKAQTNNEGKTDRPLVDRHLALFVRLIASVLRDHGAERDKPELMSRLNTLEQKLLRDDQDLSIDASQVGEHKTIEVEIPLTYDVKDMHMVQILGRIFGRNNSQLQSDVDVNRNIWTEESALKDLKAYRHRMEQNMDGALRRQDFDVNEYYEEWKKCEREHMTSMMVAILQVRPDLSKTSTSFEKPLPVRPTSIYGQDQALSDLAKMISNPGSPGPGSDPSFSMSSMSLDDNSSIRSVDEASYTFIPPDPRSFYKAILQYAMTFDSTQSDPDVEYTPLSRQSLELLTELSVWWRIPQFTRHVTFLEVAARKFMDQELEGADLVTWLDFVKEPQPEISKKPPFIQMYPATLPDIDPGRWTLCDFTIYQQTLNALNEALLRDLYDLLMHCYEPKAPSVGVIMHILLSHIHSDPAFHQKPEDAAEFAEMLTEGLRNQARDVYRTFIDRNIPQNQGDWDFSHVVKLGQEVTKLCQRIKKKYAKNPEILGVNPFEVLVETMFPSFEEDAKDLIEKIVQVAKDSGEEVNVQDGFDLYKELTEIRKIHVASLPGVPFAFHIESVLAEFVWRWINSAETRMEEFVEEAIKQDQFQVRTHDPMDIPLDAQRHSVSIIDVFQLFNQTADQVFKLEWDDDVHHAKFMTALAKAFASGIGLYCEIVEQKFAKEMDRQTAQELAAVQKTTQERFMLMAKEAWNTKEKIEPFQFYPEVRSPRSYFQFECY